MKAPPLLNRVFKTHHVFPPIPIRSRDWVAWVDGCEEDGPSGWGATEEAALADLKLELEILDIQNP